MIKKKLCIVMPTHWKAFMGGSQYQAKCLLDEIIRTGKYEIYYLARRIDESYVPERYKIISIAKSSRKPRLGYFVDAYALMRKLKIISPDVIYQRVACAYTGITSYYASHNNCRMVWHISHDDDVSEKGLSILSGAGRIIENYMVRYGIRNSSRIIAQTTSQAHMLDRNYGRQVDAVIPNFHPFPTESIDKSGPLTVVWVANFKEWKQPEIFVQLAMDFSYRSEVKFIMVGACQDKNTEWQSSLLHSIRSVPNLEYVGPKSQDEVNELLAKAHIFVNTSLYEGFANTFIQAWMRSVPVLSLHVNPDQIFDDNKVGIYTKDYHGLKEAMRLLISDASLREKMGSYAREYAYKNHSLENAKRIIKVLEFN